MDIRESLAKGYRSYSSDSDNFGSYAILTTTFATSLGAALVAAARTGRLPDSFSAGDVALIAMAAHKVSRVVAKDRVTSFARAPFTSYDGPGDINEVNESPRGSGLQRAVGELLACPLCLGAWVAGGLTTGLIYMPRATRAVATVFASLTIADFLHVAYAAAASRSE